MKNFRPIPDFENDSSLTPKQKKRRREYYAARDENIKKTHEWQSLNRDKVRASAAKMRDSNREKIRAYSREYAHKWKANNPDKVKLSREKLKEYHYEYSRDLCTRIKREVIEAYGGHCACCGETQMEFLSIDHIFNDGAKLRREGKESRGRSFYKQLKDEGFPQGRLQVLCHNCNGAKGYYGICPHERISKELVGIAIDRPRITRPRLVV